MNFNLDELAECRQFDGDFMFPEITNSRVSFIKGESVDTLNNTVIALQACNRCQIRDKCLQFAVDNQEEYGIWGGSFVNERIEKAEIYPASALGIKWHEKLRIAVLEKDGNLICPPIPDRNPDARSQRVGDYIYGEYDR